MIPHKFPLRVYYEDTDAGGVVYYANYLNFAERARTEMLRAAGHEHSALLETDGILFVVRHCNIGFLRPARLDDRLTIETRLHDSGGASLTLQQTVMRGEERLVELLVRLGVVNAQFRPARLPPHVMQSLRRAFALPDQPEP